HGPLAAGSYFFTAQYIAGTDANPTNSNASACEPLTIATTKPTAATTLKNAADDSTIANSSTIALSSSVYDTAQLGNRGSFGFTGTLTYTFYSGTPTATGDFTSGVILLASA